MIAAAYTCPHCRSTLDLIPPGGWCAQCDLPVLTGRRSPSRAGINLWCAHCKRDHHHGRHDPNTAGCRYDGMRPDAHPCICPTGAGDGHHAPHCAHDRESSPYIDTGYIVVEYAGP